VKKRQHARNLTEGCYFTRPMPRASSTFMPSDVRVLVCQVDLLAAKTVNDKIEPACKANDPSPWGGSIHQGSRPYPSQMRVRSFREALYDSGGENYFRPWPKTPAHRKLEVPATRTWY
jgi:hypothetical protein